MGSGIWVDANTHEPVGRKNKNKDNAIKIAKPAKFSPDIGNTKCCQYEACNYTFTKANTMNYTKAGGFAYAHRSDLTLIYSNNTTQNRIYILTTMPDCLKSNSMHHKGSRKGDGTPLAQTLVASRATNTDLYNNLFALKFPK